MALHDTNRQRETGGCDPFQIAASMESHNLQQGADIIDAEPGQPGTVRVERRPGKPLHPFASLTGDPSATARYPEPPGVKVTVIDSRRKTP